MEIDRRKPVLVTGANGYVASWLVRLLLEDAIDVHATVRDPDDAGKVGHLKRIAEQTRGRLTLFRADLLTERSFDAAMAGCQLVFHTASPFVIDGITDPQTQLVDPAVRGTTNVLDAADRSPDVRRVVLTSSIAAIYGDAADLARTAHGVFTEANWNTTSDLAHNPYSYSKTCAERAAWQIARAQSRWDLLVINPGLVLGPALSAATASGSFAIMRRFTDGSLRFGAPALEFGVVDVRDVAQAHLRAGFTPGASGRHVTVSDTISMLAIGQTLRRHFGDRYPFPRRTMPRAVLSVFGPFLGASRKFVTGNIGLPMRFDNSFTRADLAMTFRPVEQTVIDHFQHMIDDGAVPDRRPR